MSLKRKKETEWRRIMLLIYIGMLPAQQVRPWRVALSSFPYLFSGFSTGCAALSLRRFFYLVNPMNQEPSTLYAKLLGETSTIEWKVLQPFFAKGDLLWVDPALDLIDAAIAVTQDEAEKIKAWMASGVFGKMTAEHALDVNARDPELWAVVVSPWVMVQERAKN